MSPSEYGEFGRCEATAKTTDERCGQPATGEHGKCYFHGGGGSGASEENGNAITHGAQADPVNLYGNLDDDEQAWVDQLVDGYLDEAPFGESSPKVERLRMTCTIMYQEWSAREVVLQNGPSENTVVGVSETGDPIVQAEEHHLVGTAATHNQTVRMNLKDLGLLDDPESQKAEATQGLISIVSSEVSDGN